MQRATWYLVESGFNREYLGKYESTMAQGNGYIGLRASLEEEYPGQVRNLFVAGTFNRFGGQEVTELPNAADITALAISLNGQRFDLLSGTLLKYERRLHLRNGELTREILWKSSENETYEIKFTRFVSLADHHVIGLRVEITPLDSDARLWVKTGIDGKMTNSGAQHFFEGEKRVFENKYMTMTQTTMESEIEFTTAAAMNFYSSGKPVEADQRFSIARRGLFTEAEVTIKRGLSLVIEKMTSVHTSADKDFEGRDQVISRLKTLITKGYDHTFSESAVKWEEYWAGSEIKLQSEHSFDELAVHFAQYQLRIMVPMHDDRISIGAKALTGEGYKGHVFWDTEIFLVPYYLCTMPSVAAGLLKYRHLQLDGARRKADDNGYEGAMYPWEAALTGDEETPEWAAINIKTGKATKIWSGIKEHHITADIPYAVWNYFQFTDDRRFMIDFGGEIIFECARFWLSRMKYDDNTGLYGIYDVIGPDEYTEHINNNAFTNHMAQDTIQTAIKLYEMGLYWEGFDEVLDRLDAHRLVDKLRSVVDKLYLPGPNEYGIIPQDDTFLQKESIDVNKYRSAFKKQTILGDYSREQVNELQVLKQADVVMLLYLLRERFDEAIKKKNWYYYEEKTIHDSSMSWAVHSIAAADFHDLKKAYECFQKACEIDIGENMISSNDGIHAAAIGGICLAVIFGFGGVRIVDGELRLQPCLPKEWKSLSFPLYFKGEKINVEIR